MESEDSMSKLTKKLTRAVIILLGLLVLSPNLFADGRVTRHNRTGPQETRQHQQTGRNRFMSFIQNRRHNMRQRNFRRQMRRNMRSRIACKMCHHQNRGHENNQRGCIRP